MPRKRELHDRYFKQAKTEGYAARSAYKLKEIQERFHLIRRSDRVLDLGCAPGSWLQVASEIVGPEGRVVGIDLQRVRVPAMPNVNVLEGDIYETDAMVMRKWAYPDLDIDPPLFDVVISDMAPNTSGHGDHFLSVRLCRRAMELFPQLLREGGGTTMKVFEGEDFPDLLNECRDAFGSVKPFKPKACRDVSRETYIVAKGYRWTDKAARIAQAAARKSASQPSELPQAAAPKLGLQPARVMPPDAAPEAAAPIKNKAPSTRARGATVATVSASKRAPKPRAKPKAAPDSAVISKPARKPAATPTEKPAPASPTKSKPRPKPKSATKPASKSKAESKAQPKAKPKAKPKSKTGLKPAARAKAPSSAARSASAKVAKKTRR